MLEKEFMVEEIVTPDSQKLIAQLHDVGEVLERAYEDGKVKMKIRIHRRDKERFLHEPSANRGRWEIGVRWVQRGMTRVSEVVPAVGTGVAPRGW